MQTFQNKKHDSGGRVVASSNLVIPTTEYQALTVYSVGAFLCP